MSDTRQRIAETFQRLLEVAPAQREASLLRLCIDDPAVEAEVRKLLLAAGQTMGGGGVTGVPGPADATTIEASDISVGDERIGPYRVVRRLGEGGLGYVLLAFREDDKFRMRVAIKLVKKGMDTEEIIRRFEQERQVLSALNHPNIAKVFDAGTTADGRPYFVMEHIEGLPIDDFCDKQGLSTADRLKLFLKVCAAVHYAHQNLVIHRDIKPGNIVVTAEGEPKLLDFGIAKLLNPDLMRSPVTTGPELRLMTPEYASPEQVEGAAITTASDVYSLGVLLYELLTGRPPYHLRTRLREEIIRVICHVDPERPSTAVIKAAKVHERDGTTRSIGPEEIARTRDGQPAKLRRALVGDLDNIVMMAMAKLPRHRYASVEQLSEDLRRHLEGKTVIAHPPSRWYTFSVFLRRHAGASAAAAAALAAIVALGIVSTTQAIKLEARSRKLAESLRTETALRQEAAHQTTIAQEQKLAAEREERVRAETARLAIGIIGEIGTVSLRRPSIPTPVLGRLIEAWLSRSELEGRAELSLGLHSVVADVLAATQQHEAALVHTQAALKLGEAVYPSGDGRLARLHTRLARTLTKLGRHEQAEAHARAATAELAKAPLPDPVEMLNARWRLALTLHEAGKVGDSRALAEDVMATADRINAGTAARVNARLYVSEHASLAGEHDRALQLARAAMGLLQDSMMDGKVIATRVQVQTGIVLNRAGKTTEAERYFAQAMWDRFAKIGTVHSLTYDALRRDAEALHRLGQFTEAAKRWERGAPFREEQDGMRHARTAWLRLRMAAAYFGAGDETQGRANLTRAVSRGVASDPRDRAWSRDVDKAEKALREGTWQFDPGLAGRLGDLAWMIGSDEPTPADNDDIDVE